MTIYQRIKRLRESKGLTQQELAEKVGFKTASAVNKIELGLRDINQSKIIAFAKALGVSPGELMGDSVEKTADTIKSFPTPILTDDTVDIPVIGEIAAGYNMLVNEEWSGETVSVPASYLKGRAVTDFFVLSVKGSSMYPLYQDGDKVLILKQNHINNSGDVAAVVYDSDYATLKKIEILKDVVRLVPINPEYEPKEIKDVDLEKYHILGVPRLLVREID